MLHLAIICMVCAVLAPIKGTALTGINNNKSNIFCHVDEREERRVGKFFPGLYNVDDKNCFECDEKQNANRTHCIFYNNITKQCQFSGALCSFKNKFPGRKKRNSDSQLEYTVRKRNVYRRVKNKGKMLVKKLKSSHAKKPQEPKPCLKLTEYERYKLRQLKKVKHKRKKRRTRKSHLDKVEIDDDLDMDKRIEKVVRRLALENMRTEENSLVSPPTEPVPVTDVSTRLSEKETASPFFNNVKQIFKFSKEYFNSKRASQEKRDVTDPIPTERIWNTVTESENRKKSARLGRNVLRHIIHNRLRRCANTLNTPNRVAFSAVKRKRRRRKRDYLHHRPRLESYSKQRWPLFDQMYSNYDYNDYDSNTTGSQALENKSSLVVTTVLPSFHNTSSINHTNNFSITDSEPLADRQRNYPIRESDVYDDYDSRNFFLRSFEKDATNRYSNNIDKKTLRFPYNRKRFRSGRHFKISRAFRNYIRRNFEGSLRERILMDRKKRCEGRCNGMPHRCWRSAPLLCIPYIRKGQDELLKYIIRTLQDLLGKPMPRKVDIFEKIKFKPYRRTAEPTCEEIMPIGENESPTYDPAPAMCVPNLPCQQPLQNSPASTPFPAFVLYQTFPATNPTCQTMACPLAETVTTCSSCTCSLEKNGCSQPGITCSPPVTGPTPVTCPAPVTCPQPVTCPSSTICPPSTPASVPKNTCALMMTDSSTTVIPPAVSEQTVTASENCDSNCGYSTDTQVSPGGETSIQAPPQSQVQNPVSFVQMTAEYNKSSDVNRLESSVNTSSPNYPVTSITPGYSFPKPPSNTVTPQVQGYTTVSPQVSAALTQGMWPQTTQTSPSWYNSDPPIEKSEVLTITAIDCSTSPQPDLCYQYYQTLAPPNSKQEPQFSNQRNLVQQNQQVQQIPYNMYAYRTDRTPVQQRPMTMGYGTRMPLEFDLSYDGETKPSRDFYESNTMRDYSSQPNPSGENGLKEKNSARSQRKFKVEEDENLFPGDPFAYKYMETTQKFVPRIMRPKLHRRKFSNFMRLKHKRLPTHYDYPNDPLPRDQKAYNEKYDTYYPTDVSERDFDTRLRKRPRMNQRREKRDSFYRDNYPESKSSYNYDNYPEDDANYDDQYPENLLLPKLENNHWARKREDEQNSSTPGTYELFSELAEIATLAPNETEKVTQRSVNVTSTESFNETLSETVNVTNSNSSSQVDCIDKLDNGQRSGYNNSPNPSVSLLSAGHTTTVKQIPATTYSDATTPTLTTTTLENKASTHALKSNEGEKAQIVDSGKPDKEVGSNHDLEAGEEQIMTTLQTASIVKGPKKLFTKPTPKVYTKVYPDSLPNEMETNETPTPTTTPKTDRTTVVQSLAAPDVRLQLLAVCEGYLEIVKLIKAQNQSLEEELDSDLSQYCENIISQSFNLAADNAIIKSKKPEKSPTSTTTTTQTASANSNKVSKRRSCNRYRPTKDESSHQDLRAKVVVDILRSPIYKKDLAAYVDQNYFYSKGRMTKRTSSQTLKTDNRGKSGRKYKGRAKKNFPDSKNGLRNQRKKLRNREGTKENFSKKKSSEEEKELLHLLRQRKRDLLSWLSDPKENEVKPNDVEETEYLDDDEDLTITADTTEDSGTIKPKGDQKTSESTTKTGFYINDTIFPIYAKQYGYDKGGELREVDVLWRRVNEETHEKKIFKNMSVLALLLTSSMAPYIKRKESRFVGGNAYEAEDEAQPNRDNRAGLVDPSPSYNEKPPTTTSTPPPSSSTTINFVSSKPELKQPFVTVIPTTGVPTTPCFTTASEQATPTIANKSRGLLTTEQTEIKTVQPNNSSQQNQTYIFMRKPDPSTIVASTPNTTKAHKNTTHKMSRKLELAKDFFQEYSIEFLNYAVYILPIMFTILFLMCCLCCFLQILNSRGGGRRKKKKKTLLCTEEDFDTTGDSDGETNIRKKKKWKKTIKTNVDCENLENRRLRAFWNVLKMNARGKQRVDLHVDTTTPTEKRRSFLQFLKGKKESVKPEELAALSYPPPGEHNEVSDEEARIPLQANDEFDSEMKVPVRDRTEVDERREIISLLEELKKIELENLEERKNKKSVCVQYMAEDEEKTVFKKPDIPASYEVNKYFGSDPFSDKKFPFHDPNPEELNEDAGEFMELVPYEGEYIQRKSSSMKRSDIRVNRGGRCERFLNMFRGSGDAMNFVKSGNGNKSYNYTKYKNISTDTKDELMGGTHTNADIDKNLSDDMFNSFPAPYIFQRKRETDIVDEMENLKRQLNKKKNVRLKDNGVLCRL